MHTGKTLWRLAETVAKGIKPDLKAGVLAVFWMADQWVDDDQWSWMLADPRLYSCPYYYGIQA